jgi:cytochrome c oxidase assembly protein subunit 15
MSNKSFKISVIVSFISVFLVILAGSLVRMTGSGMGCPDWPKCFGYLIPPTNEKDVYWKPNYEYESGMMILHKENFYVALNDFKTGKTISLNNWKKYTIHDYNEFSVTNTWFEFINRLIGALAGLCTLIMLGISLKFIQSKPTLPALSLLVVLSMGFQAWLGKQVVDSNLTPYKITIHMFMAILILAVIIFLYNQSNDKKKFS